MTNDERQALVNHRQEKAKDTLGEIETLIRNEFLNNAVNRLYYACYYSVSALLIKRGLQTKTHTGARQLFGLHFVKAGLISQESGDFYTLIFELRQTGDYGDFIVFLKEEVYALIEPAKTLIKEVEALLT